MICVKHKNLTLLHSNDLHGDFLAEKIDEQLMGGVSMLSRYPVFSRTHLHRSSDRNRAQWR